MTEFIALLILNFTLWFILFTEKIDNRILKTIFDWLPPILFAYIVPAGMAILLNIDFSHSALHKINTNYLVPFAVLMVMSTLTLSQVKLIGVKPLLVFVSGSLWIALFPIFCFAISEFFNWNFLSNRGEIWKAIPPLVGSWIGGSTSQIVLKEIVNCPDGLFISVLVIDNILVNFWTIFMFQFIKRTERINQWFHLSTRMEIKDIPNHTESRMNGLGSIVILFFMVWITSILDISFVQRIVLLSVIGFSLPHVFKKWNGAFLLKYAHIPILCIMIILGFKLRFEQIYMDGGFILFLIVWLLSHLIFMTFISWLIKSNSVWIAISSMANVGGISTAPAVTSAYDKRLMPHAILLAILSMVTGTIWGGITIWFFKNILGYS